jgi:hypothetical protein
MMASTAVTSSGSGYRAAIFGLGVLLYLVDLLRHGYVLAMANLHVILDFPLVEIPETAKFMKLVTSSQEPR